MDKIKDNRINNNLQNITQNTFNRATGIPLITRSELSCSGSISSSSSHVAPVEMRE